MTAKNISQISTLRQLIIAWVRPNWSNFRSARLFTLWVAAIIAGIFAGLGVMLFREAIVLLHAIWVDTRSENLASAAAIAPWYIVLTGPIFGGLLVGWFLLSFQPNKRVGGVADVMEARAVSGRQLTLKHGIFSAIISAISLGFGASAGREGPMVHLGANLAAAINEKLNLPAWSGRTLLACGVAGAVAASFNAPIAGVLFAHEVILGHYARRSFVPIVMASVAATVVSHIWFGNLVTFTIPNYQIQSYLEFPAFVLLGVVCALVAISFQTSLAASDFWARKIDIPLWLRPVIGGAIIGTMGIFIPEILGVGYEPTDNALHGKYGLLLLILLIFAKIAATAITLASRFGGGVFSPALYIGAMTGAAFGLISASILPQLASDAGLYAILGMGAVAATVLGAPFSTVVIVFELTGEYSTTIAVLVTVAIASGVNQALHGRSFFEWQLEARGQFLHQGPHKHFLTRTQVRDFYEAGASNEELDLSAPALLIDDSLEHALRLFDETGESKIAIVGNLQKREIIGWATHVRALSYFNTALVEASKEEHR